MIKSAALALLIGFAVSGLSATASAKTLTTTVRVTAGHPSVVLGPLVHKTKCPAWPSGTGLLSDGDFSEAKYPGSSYTTLYYRHGVPGWFGETANLCGSEFQTPYGVCSIDVGGGASGGQIIHHFPRPQDHATYTLTFLLSGNGACGPTVKALDLLVWGRHGGFEQTFTWDTSNGNDAQHGAFGMESWQFTIIKEPQLALYARTSDDCGPVVAAFSLTQNPSKGIRGVRL
jgi:hypothetical protein